jgi:hypothetical protein
MLTGFLAFHHAIIISPDGGFIERFMGTSAPLLAGPVFIIGYFEKSFRPEPFAGPAL